MYRHACADGAYLAWGGSLVVLRGGPIAVYRGIVAVSNRAYRSVSGVWYGSTGIVCYLSVNSIIVPVQIVF